MCVCVCQGPLDFTVVSLLLSSVAALKSNWQTKCCYLLDSPDTTKFTSCLELCFASVFAFLPILSFRLVRCYNVALSDKMVSLVNLYFKFGSRTNQRIYPVTTDNVIIAR